VAGEQAGLGQAALARVRGEAVGDESLRPVAPRLAAELLSGGLTSQVGGWSWLVLTAVGAVELMAFAALWLVSGHPQARFASLVASGMFALSMGSFGPGCCGTGWNGPSASTPDRRPVAAVCRCALTHRARRKAVDVAWCDDPGDRLSDQCSQLIVPR